MITTSEVLEEIQADLSLTPSAEYRIKKILRGLDGEQVIDDLDEDEE